MDTPRNPALLQEYSFLLRAVSTGVPASDILYEGARLLSDEPTDAGRAVNRTICTMVATLLGLPEAEPDLTERVLRSLP